MSKQDIDFLSVEISPIMRAAAVSNAAEMQWALDVITLSNARRWGNEELFEGKRDICIEKVKQLPPTLNIVKQHEKTILECLKPTFWESADENRLDLIIHELGPLMKTATRHGGVSNAGPQGQRDAAHMAHCEGETNGQNSVSEIVAQFISGLADQSEAVRKVRDGKMVTAEEIQEIVLLLKAVSIPSA